MSPYQLARGELVDELALEALEEGPAVTWRDELEALPGDLTERTHAATGAPDHSGPPDYLPVGAPDPDRVHHAMHNRIRAILDGARQAIDALEAQVLAGTVPAGPAGGHLVGAYPAPELGPGVVRAEHVAPDAAIPPSAIALPLDADTAVPALRQSFVRSPAGSWKVGDAFGGPYANGNVFAAGIAYWSPLAVLEPETWSGLAWWVAAAGVGAGSVYRAALFYDDGEGRPGNAVIDDLGTLPATTGGFKVFDFANPILRQLAPGLYHAGLKVEGALTTNPQLWGIKDHVGPGRAAGDGSVNPAAGGNQYTMGQAAGPFPDPAGQPSTNSNWRPLVFARVVSRP